MRVGIVVPTGLEGRSESATLRDLYRAEFLAASVRSARHKPHALQIPYPFDPNYYRALLEEKRPHLLIYWAAVEASEQIATLTDMAYQIDPARPQFVAGPWPTLDPDGAVECGPINGLLRGECDVTLAKMLTSLNNREELKQVAGLWLRRAKGPIHEAPLGQPVALERLPVPDFQSFDWPGLASVTRGTMPAEASRGSSGLSQIFLTQDFAARYDFGTKSATSISSKFRRMRPVDDLLRDIQTMRMRIDPLRLDFVDECFPYETDWLEEFAAKYPATVGLPFSAPVASAWHRSTQINLLKQAGMYRASIGLESGSEFLRGKYSDWNPTNALLKDMAEQLLEAGIEIELEIVLGMPGEKRSDLEETLKLLEEFPFTTLEPTVFRVTPKTKLYDRLAKHGELKTYTGRGTRETLIRSAEREMEIGQFLEAIQRLNLNKQVEDFGSHRGYFSFVEHVASATHRIANLQNIGITRIKGEPAFTMTAPAESSYACFLEPKAQLQGRLELLVHEDETNPPRGKVQVEATFEPEEGGSLRLFQAKLDGASRRGRVFDFSIPLPVDASTRGRMIFSARDAGGGRGLPVAWVDPILIKTKKVKAEAVEPVPDIPGRQRAEKQPEPLPPSSGRMPKPVPALDLSDFELNDSSNELEMLPKSSDKPKTVRTQQSPALEVDNPAGVAGFYEKQRSGNAPKAEDKKEKKRSNGGLPDQLVRLMEELSDSNERVRELEEKLERYEMMMRQQRDMLADAPSEEIIE